MNKMRIGNAERKTKETEISVSINLDANEGRKIDSGIPFLDHMLDSLACFGRLGLSLRCQGDLVVDDHHSVEDCALALAQATRSALNETSGITRTSSVYIAMDESLVRLVLDLSGRPSPLVDLPFKRESIGGVATENITHFFNSFAMQIGAALHLDCLRSANDHHLAEAAFKALGLALFQATRLIDEQILSTKGVVQ